MASSVTKSFVELELENVCDEVADVGSTRGYVILGCGIEVLVGASLPRAVPCILEAMEKLNQVST